MSDADIRVLGSGITGCVVRPPPKCRHSPSRDPRDTTRDPDLGPDLIAKLAVDEGAVAHELWMAARVRHLDPSSKWTVVPQPGWCEVDLPEKCLTRDISGMTGETNALRTVMSDGGKTLFHTLDMDIGLDEYVVAVEYLLQGLRHLLLNGIVHGDLHGNNMVFSSVVDADGLGPGLGSGSGVMRRQRLRIIDFGKGCVSTDVALLGTDVRVFLGTVIEWATLRKSVKVDEYSKYATSTARFSSTKNRLLQSYLEKENDASLLIPRLPEIWSAFWQQSVTPHQFRLWHLFGIPVTAVVLPRAAPDEFHYAPHIRAQQDLHSLLQSVQGVLGLNMKVLSRSVSFPDYSDEAKAVVRSYRAMLQDVLDEGVESWQTEDDVLLALAYMDPANGTLGRTAPHFWYTMVYIVPLVLGIAILPYGGMVDATALLNTKAALFDFSHTQLRKDTQPVSMLASTLSNDKSIIPFQLFSIIEEFGF